MAIDWTKPLAWVEGKQGSYKGEALTYIGPNPLTPDEIIVMINESNFIKVNKKTGESQKGTLQVKNAPEPWLKAMNDWSRSTGYTLGAEQQEVFKAGFLAASRPK